RGSARWWSRCSSFRDCRSRPRTRWTRSVRSTRRIPTGSFPIMARLTTTVILDGLAFPEGPRWHDGRLWFSDQHDKRVVAMSVDGTAETIRDAPQQPSGLVSEYAER